MMKKLGFLILISITLFLGIGFYNCIEITNYSVHDKALPKGFDGYRVVFLSDLHCKVLGENESKLIRAVYSCDPDIVVFTGDMIDGDHTDISSVRNLFAGLAGKYPMFAVSGNHEKDYPLNYRKLLEYYEEYGVNNLDNESRMLSLNGSHIGIYGLPYQNSYYIYKTSYPPDLSANDFNILLYHDATVFSPISSYGYNLVLSGHTHGGIVRIPFIGGMINNNGSLFSEYDNGMYQINGSTLISNRGIGDSYFPRFYNRSEVVCITLRTDTE